MSTPKMFIVPEVGSTTFVKLLKVVLFPAPLTPSKAKHSPSLTANDAFSTARIGLLKGTLYTFRNLLTQTECSLHDWTRTSSSNTSWSRLSSESLLEVGYLKTNKRENQLPSIHCSTLAQLMFSQKMNIIQCPIIMATRPIQSPTTLLMWKGLRLRINAGRSALSIFECS